MFDGEDDVLAATGEIGVRVPEGVDVGASSKGEAGVGAVLLGGVVDEEDGEVEASLE
ncbi:MAG: hypothetical protein GWN82_09760, partial [Gemmatimonadetes bacterium]|nr:hypothetical protein [Gemmatimonadota bacterium]NIW64048.1 hypothetical protein [Gemmatimonadota bacterium]